MLRSKFLTVLLLAIMSLGLSGCVASYVAGKAVGTAVDVTTGAASLAVRGTAATGRAVVGVVTGDDCEAESDEEDDASEDDDEEDC